MVDGPDQKRVDRRGLLRTAGIVGGLSALGIGAAGTAAGQSTEFDIPLKFSDQSTQASLGGNGSVDIETVNNEINAKAFASIPGENARALGLLFGKFTPPASANYVPTARYFREGSVGELLGSGRATVIAFAEAPGEGRTGTVLETIETDVSGTVTRTGSGTGAGGNTLLLRGTKTYNVGIGLQVTAKPRSGELISVDFSDEGRKLEAQDFGLFLPPNSRATSAELEDNDASER